MERDLLGTAREVFGGGLQSTKDSPAKFKEQAEALELLAFKLRQNQYNLGTVLCKLYGEKLEAVSSQAQVIVARCKQWMKKDEQQPLSPSQFEDLVAMVEAAQQDAERSYTLELDARTTTRAACLAGLGARHEGRWMEQQGERLRQAIDRKQWVINGLLQTLGLAHRARPKRRSRGQKAATPHPLRTKAGM